MSFADKVRETAGPSFTKRLRQLDAILQAKGIDLADLEDATVRKVGFWQAMHRDDKGEAVITDLARIELAPSWETGPAWPVVQPAPRPRTPPAAKVRPRRKTWQTAAMLPDMQVGYFHNMAGQLEPIHDEAAIAVALAIVADENPDMVVLHGDNADLCEFGKYRFTDAFAQTTQATIHRLTTFGEQLRQAAPRARIVWLEGNHEARLPNYIADNARGAFGLTRGKLEAEPGDRWPVLSLPHLCHFDHLGIEYLAGYPANDLWLNDNVRAIHGNKVDSKGVTGTKYLDAEKQSTYYGHIHRRELAQRTRTTRFGPRTSTARSFGCLCRIDGVVPSTNGGIDLFGRPVASAENWQQGLGFIHFQPGDGLHADESVEILNGWAMHRGKEYRA